MMACGDDEVVSILQGQLWHQFETSSLLKQDVEGLIPGHLHLPKQVILKKIKFGGM